MTYDTHLISGLKGSPNKDMDVVIEILESFDKRIEELEAFAIGLNELAVGLSADFKGIAKSFELEAEDA